jgi:hypothetical protein
VTNLKQGRWNQVSVRSERIDFSCGVVVAAVVVEGVVVVCQRLHAALYDPLSLQFVVFQANFHRSLSLQMTRGLLSWWR